MPTTEVLPYSKPNNITTKEALIYNYLYKSRVSTSKKVFKKIQELPSEKENNLLQKYVGFFQGIYYRKAKANNNDNVVEYFLLEIKANGHAIMTVPNIDKPYIGRVRVIFSKNDALMGYFDYLVKESTYRFY